MIIPRAITLAPIALQHLNFSFPDCTQGALSNNLVCNPNANYWDRAQAIVNQFTTSELIQNTINYAVGVERLGIPKYQWWSEALHGVSDSPGVSFQPAGQEFSSATNFPHIINLGATFDDQLYNDVANHIANETRAYNNAGFSGLNLYSPLNINNFRDPRWGRGQETVGEDTMHMQRYARSMVSGLQGPDPLHLKVAAACKHYLAYDVEEFNGVERYQFNAVVSKQDLADFYIPQFRACIRDAQAAVLMSSYNAVNGVPPSASKYWLDQLARQAWNFDRYHNYVTSDCDAVANVYDGHHYANSYLTAASDSMNAGTDLNCGGTYTDQLQNAVNQNLTSVATLRRAVSRMFASLVRLGYFDSPDKQPLRKLTWKDVNTQSSQQLAYQAAVDSAVLLKNDGTLPLDKHKIQTVAVIGPLATATDALRGNYAGPGPYTISVLDAAKKVFKTANWTNGTQINTQDTSDFQNAINIAKNADAIIYVGGIDNTIESEGMDRNDIKWPGNQLDLIKQLSQVGKPLVVLQLGGGQVDDTDLKNNAKVNAIMWGGYPGQSGGRALIDLILGVVTPSGRLPITQYPADYINNAPEDNMSLRPNGSYPGRTYQWYDGAVYPFGHGLHYTNFTATLTKDNGKTFTIDHNPDVGSDYAENRVIATIDAKVTNTGKVPSDYIALLYATHQNGPAPYPKRTLVAYTKLNRVGAGQTYTAHLQITQGALARADENGNKVLYPGKYNLMLDNFNAPLATGSITLQGAANTVVPWIQALSD